MIETKYNYKQILFIALLLLVLTFSVYFGSLFNGFIIDDNNIIVKAEVVKTPGLIFKNYPHPFLKAYFRPIVVLSYCFDYSLWKLNPLGYHLTNMLLHFLTALLVFLGLNLLLGELNLAGLTSILFAIHPINSVTVNYISDRSNILAAIFMLLALFSFCYGYKKQKINWYLAGGVLLTGAFLCRESAVIFPLYLIILLVFIREKAKDRQILILFSLLSLMSIMFLIFRHAKFSSMVCTSTLKFFSIKHINAFLFIIIKYFKLIFAPDNIAFYRIIDLEGLCANNIFYSIAILLCMAFLVFRFFKNKTVLLALSWFLAGMLPLYYMMFCRPQEGLMMQDSWIYLSSVGGVLLISYALIEINKRIDKRLGYILIVLVVFLFARKTAGYSQVWHDEKTYFDYWQKADGNNSFVGLYFADYYYKRKEYDQAAYYYEKIKDFRSAAIASLKNGKLKEAVIFNKMAAKNDQNNPDIYLDLAYLHCKLNNFNKAIYYNKKVLKVDPKSNKAYFNLFQIYSHFGKEEKAEAAKAKAIELGYDW